MPAAWRAAVRRIRDGTERRQLPYRYTAAAQGGNFYSVVEELCRE